MLKRELKRAISLFLSPITRFQKNTPLPPILLYHNISEKNLSHFEYFHQMKYKTYLYPITRTFPQIIEEIKSSKTERRVIEIKDAFGRENKQKSGLFRLPNIKFRDVSLRHDIRFQPEIKRFTKLAVNKKIL